MDALAHAEDAERITPKGVECDRTVGEARKSVAVGRTVVGARQGGDGIDVGCFSAGEESTWLGTGFLCRCDLIRTAVGHHVREQADGGGAEAVAHKVELVGAVPVEARNEGLLRVVPSVPLMAVLLRVQDAVVHTGAGQLGIQLAGAVPTAGERPDRGLVELAVAICLEIFHLTAAGESVVVNGAGKALIASPAHHAVDKDGGILASLYGRGRGRNSRHDPNHGKA